MSQTIEVAWATLPRSGSFYQHFVVEYWNALLVGHDRIERYPGSHAYPALGLVRHQSHADAPGLRASADPALLASRDAIAVADYGLQRFPEVGWDGRALAPADNPAARVVYSYRNPLDHAVSMFHHTRGNADWQREEAAAGLVLDGGTDLDGFVTRLALPKFARHFLGYELLRRAHPAAVLMVAYEDLMRRPAETFRRIMQFLGLDRPGDAVPDRRWRAALDQAIEHSAPDRMRALERSLPGGSLLGTPDQANRSHLQSGEIGRWREVLDPGCLAAARDLLAPFAVDVDDRFDFE